MTSRYPGRDEIILSAPAGQPLCNSRACVNAGRRAEVLLTFGTLADPGSGPHSRDALWPGSWGCAYPVCAGCCDRTCQVARRYRPDLVITDLTGQQPPCPP